jgi:hypothetical protein
MIKVDDKVKISPAGKLRYGDSYNNPYDAEGVVIEVREGYTFRYKVDWSGFSNSYKEGELELVISEEKELKPMTKVIYSYSPDSVTVVLNGEIYVITSSEGAYTQLVEELKAPTHDLEAIEALVDKTKAVEKFSNGQVTVEGGVVFYQGQEINNSLTDKMLSMMDEGFDITPWATFLENLEQNPSFRSRQCLFNFLEKFQAPFTEDGCFIAFKRVRNDFKDIYTGTMDNSVGTVVKMDRRDVNEDPNATCSAGLHVAADSYLSHYASADRNKTIMLKVNPRDVVAVPHDYNHAKMRVCQYEVIADITPAQMDELKTKPVLTSSDYTEDDRDIEEGDMVTLVEYQAYLTVGESYEVLEVDDYDDTIRVLDDDGDPGWYDINSFKL